MNALETFALRVLEASRDELGDLDGGWIQDQAEELGLLVRVEVARPCCDECRCAECGEFPQECLVMASQIHELKKESA